MNFINLPRGRRLVPVPAASLKANLNACYHPEMDLTAAELPLAGNGSDLSLILILPGRQADFVAGGLGRLEDKINLGRESVRCCLLCVAVLQSIVWSAYACTTPNTSTMSALGKQCRFK